MVITYKIKNTVNNKRQPTKFYLQLFDKILKELYFQNSLTEKTKVKYS